MIKIEMLKKVLSLLMIASFLVQDNYAHRPLKNKTEKNIKKQAERRERYNLKKLNGGSDYSNRLKYMKERYARVKDDPENRQKYQEMLQNSRIRSSSRRLSMKYNLPIGTLPGGRYDHKTYYDKYQERRENQERVRELTTASVLLGRKHEGLAQVMQERTREPRKKVLEAHEEMWNIYKKGAVPDSTQQTMVNQEGGQ